MSIIYADEMGNVIVEVQPEYGISFCNGKAYFTTIEDEEMEIDMTALREIITA